MIKLKNPEKFTKEQITSDMVAVWIGYESGVMTKNSIIKHLVVSPYKSIEIPIKKTYTINKMKIEFEEILSAWSNQFGKIKIQILESPENPPLILNFINECYEAMYKDKMQLIDWQLIAIRDALEGDNRRLNKFRDAEQVSYCDVENIINKYVTFLQKSKDFRNKKYYNAFINNMVALTKDHPTLDGIYFKIDCAQ